MSLRVRELEGLSSTVQGICELEGLSSIVRGCLRVG